VTQNTSTTHPVTEDAARASADHTAYILALETADLTYQRLEHLYGSRPPVIARSSEFRHPVASMAAVVAAGPKYNLYDEPNGDRVTLRIDIDVVHPSDRIGFPITENQYMAFDGDDGHVAVILTIDCQTMGVDAEPLSDDKIYQYGKFLTEQLLNWYGTTRNHLPFDINYVVINEPEEP
jgi:hypothetical protein